MEVHCISVASFQALRTKSNVHDGMQSQLIWVKRAAFHSTASVTTVLRITFRPSRDVHRALAAQSAELELTLEAPHSPSSPPF
jgi:hypothetical protein